MSVGAVLGGEGEQTSDLGWICDRYRSRAVGYAFAVLHDHDIAEDAVQLAFARIVARVASGDRALLDDDPERVVIRNTRWAALELVERRRRTDGLEAADESAGVKELSGRVWERSQARQLCDQIAADLPTHYRDVLRMRFVEQHRDTDAAARLRISVKAYRCRLDRALREARQAATRLGIDSLGGLVVVGWRAVVRRSARLQAAVQADGENLNGISQAAIHGGLAIALAAGLVAFPLLAGSSQGAGGPAPLLVAGQLSTSAGGPPATYGSRSQGSSTGCDSCERPAAVLELTGGALPLQLASTGTATLPTSTSQVGSLVGSSQPQVRSAVGETLNAGTGDAGSALATASAAVSPAADLATVPPPSAPSLPVPTPSLP